MRGLTIVACLLVLFLASGFALAQKKANPKTPETAPIIKTLPPAYNAQLLRLAEILGSIHYLRDLCNAKEGMQWREQMENILEKEQPTAERQAELIGRFNRGFRAYNEIYRECTGSAIEAANLYLRQGRRLAGEIPNRYGR